MAIGRERVDFVLSRVREVVVNVEARPTFDEIEALEGEERWFHHAVRAVRRVLEIQSGA